MSTFQQIPTPDEFKRDKRKAEKAALRKAS